MMKTPQKIMRLARTSFVVILFVGSMLGSCGLTDLAFAKEEKQKEGYVRTVDSPPPLAEMDKEPGWRYNSDYLFSISRAVRDSTVPPAGKVFLFIPAIPLDIVLSPFAAIAGLFGD